MSFDNLNNLSNLNALGSSGGTQFSAGSFGTLMFWVSDISGVYTDLGVTPATNGQTIQQWNDLSGKGNHLIQNTAGSRPTYTTNSQNGLPGITCNNKQLSKAFTWAQPGHIFMVWKQTEAYNTGRRITDGGTDLSCMFRNTFPSTPATPLELYAGSLGGARNSFTNGTTYVMDYLFSGAASFIRINNDSRATTGNPGAGDLAGFSVGGSIAGAAGVNSVFYEIMGFNNNIGDASATTIINYLRSKWGV